MPSKFIYVLYLVQLIGVLLLGYGALKVWARPGIFWPITVGLVTIVAAGWYRAKLKGEAETLGHLLR